MEGLLIRILLLVFLLPVGALSLSCGSSGESAALVTGDFVVRFDPIEGGCWNLVAADNTIYGPIRLDDGYRVDGLRVTASLELQPQSIIICNGAPVEIVEITPVRAP